MIILKYFWLICAIWSGLGNAITFRKNISFWIKKKVLNQKWANKAFIVDILLTAVPFLILQIIQLHLNADFAFPTWQHPYNYYALLTIFIPIMFFLFWLWFLNGSHNYAKYYYYGRSLKQENDEIDWKKYSIKVKYITTLICIIGIIISCTAIYFVGKS